MKLNDTIAAIATPRGVGGIAIIRISGEKSVEIAEKTVKPADGTKLSDVCERVLTLCRIYEDKDLKMLIDRALAAVMYAPRSYTGETVVEINCHGGYFVAEKILDSLLKNGARLAEAGEFTRRAVINGKTNLLEAEAVIDLINSTSELGLHNAALSVNGCLTEKVSALRERVMNMASHISAAADYPEEVDVPEKQGLINELKATGSGIEELISGYDTGRILRDGVRTAIVGKPNVGKSSVLNALLKSERAIVTDIPGTTRDTVEETVNIGGISLRLIDTAGIREASDSIEKMGIEKSVQNIKDATLCLFVIDSSDGLGDEDRKIAEYLKEKKTVVILNKTDKSQVTNEQEFEKALGFKPSAFVKTSVAAGGEAFGIDTLEATISDVMLAEKIDTESVYISNERQRDALYKAKDALSEALEGFINGVPYDLLYIGLEDTLSALGEVTGETVREEICDRVFERFCVGK